jgi:hypothetical protein
MKIRLWLCVLATTAGFAAVSAASGASTPTPYAQMKTVIADANAKLSVRVTTDGSTAGKRVVQVTDAGRNEGRQVVTLTQAGTSDVVIAELVGGNLYVRGDVTMLTTYMGLTQVNATELAGQWFGIARSSSYYSHVVQGLTVSTGMAEVTMNPSLSAAPAVTLAGVKVNVLKGTSVQTLLQPSYHEKLYFTTAKRPLPVEVTQSAGSTTGTILFSHWNEKIVLTAPTISQYLN